MSPDSVVLEFAMVPIPQGDADSLIGFWDSIDEQAVPIDIRRRISSRGLRCGILGSQLPDWLRKRVEDQRNSIQLDATNATAVMSDLAVPRRLQCRADECENLSVTEVCASIEVEGEEGATETRKWADAECQFALTASPRKDGRVSLTLVPEIQHGQMRQQWIGKEGAFRLAAGREREVFEDLRISATLAPGQTFVVGTTIEAESLGRAFLGGGDARATTARLLLFRLAQTQLDDLFLPEERFTPIATERP